jgi:DinB superfamily
VNEHLFGVWKDQPVSIAELGLDDAVSRFCAVTLTLPEEALAEELSASVMAGEGRWKGYSGVREVVLRVYLELRELAVLTAEHRSRRGEGMTQAQHILAQYHVAWRHLTGALAGVRDDELDLEPTAGEWPLRTVLEHIISAETGFSWVVRATVTGVPRPDRRPAADVSGSLADILGRYAVLHTAILDEFASLSDGQLLQPSSFWEDDPIELRFRLLRFDAHLREHSIQVEKTLGWLRHIPSEPERLVRALHNALGEAEGSAIGAPHAAAPERAHLAAEIKRLAAVLMSHR